jgi:hypothetical protein
MYVSRLLFHTIPGKTGEVEKELKKLREMVRAAGGNGARVLHTPFRLARRSRRGVRTRSTGPPDTRATDSAIDRQPGLPELEPAHVEPAHAVSQARGLYS